MRFETCDITNEQVETSNNHNYVEDRDASHIADHQQPAKSIKSTKSKAGSAQRRVLMMFFFLSYCCLHAVVHTSAYHTRSIVYT